MPTKRLTITPTFCPQCGAELPYEKECRSLFDQCLALEFEHPATFGQIHFLTVACYMLQHNVYSEAAWLEARKMVASFIRQGILPDQLRKKRKREFEGSNRNWSVTKGEKLAEFEEIDWSRTIADIRLDNAEIYRADIESWAKSVIDDTEFIMDKGG